MVLVLAVIQIVVVLHNDHHCHCWKPDNQSHSYHCDNRANSLRHILVLHLHYLIFVAYIESITEAINAKFQVKLNEYSEHSVVSIRTFYLLKISNPIGLMNHTYLATY